MSKAVLKKNLQYRKKYSSEIGKQIFAKAHQEKFKELKANLLTLQLHVNSSGDLVDVKTINSSGFEEVDTAFLQATKEIKNFPEPELERFRTNAVSLASEIPLDLSFYVGKAYKNSPADALEIGSQLGSIGLNTASIVRNILILAH